MSLPFKENDLIVFTGDSITDGSRIRSSPDSPGTGYVYLIAGQLQDACADRKLRIRNTGISGDCSCDLVSRWSRDCVAMACPA